MSTDSRRGPYGAIRSNTAPKQRDRRFGRSVEMGEILEHRGVVAGVGMVVRFAVELEDLPRPAQLLELLVEREELLVRGGEVGVRHDGRHVLAQEIEVQRPAARR